MQIRAGSADWKTIAEHFLFGSGRPLLLMPAEGILPQNLDHVAIAWDGGATANRAVHDAMPLITGARSVTILTAGTDKDIADTSTESLTRYLQRHEIEPRLAKARSSKHGIAHDLQTAALAEQAKLMVMGAYGHNRLREFILGGATSGVLDRPIMPLFLSR